MPVYKDKKYGTWYSSVYYKDWTGKTKRTTRRGFATRKEAVEWEASFRVKESGDLDMTFGEFYELYEKDKKPQIKMSTWITKEAIIKSRLLPYFGNRKMNEIKATDIIKWQNEMLSLENGKNGKYAQTYLKSCQAQLSCIFNHACKLYGLRINPIHQAGSFKQDEKVEMKFWTKEEYLTFIQAIADKQESYVAFEILYWCGLRMGECLALTPADFDFEKLEIRVNKTYQKLKGKDVITTPKTANSNRRIAMPDFVAEEVKTYISMLYGVKDSQRIFSNMSKGKFHHEMDRGCKATGVKRIRIHDLRHSHVSLLINMGFDAVAIAKRMGHESIRVTYRYAHMFPGEQIKMAQKLSDEREDFFNVGEDKR